jgi:hypothetical protein
MAQLLVGSLIAGGSLLGSLFAGKDVGATSPSQVYGQAEDDLRKAYRDILTDYDQRYDVAINNAMALYPQFADEIRNAYDIEKNKFFKELQGTLDTEYKQLRSDIAQSKKEGRLGLAQLQARHGVTGGRQAAQLTKQQTQADIAGAKQLLAQQKQGQQLLGSLAQQTQLGQAGAISGLASQFGGIGARAQLGRPAGQLQLGGQLLSGLASLGSQRAGAQVAGAGQPSGVARLLGTAGGLGGALIGQELGLDEGRISGLFNPQQTGG